MTLHIIPAWKQAPFLRMLIPFISGIVLSWYLHPNIILAWFIFFCTTVIFFLFSSGRIFFLFKYNWLRGILLNILIFTIGILLLSYHDYSTKKKFGNSAYKKYDVVIAILEEPLSEKSKTFKAEASVQMLIRNDSFVRVKLNILLYIQKDSTIPRLKYGTKIIFSKPLQDIKNSGIPGAFDYERYCAFQHIFHQVFLKKNEFLILPGTKENILKKYLFATRQKLLTILKTFLKTKKETGLAEALLIGYKDDLDKDLVRSYTQTGVVHIIAISGLHLALIYGLLHFFLDRIKTPKKLRWIKPFILISSLWMFSFIIIGKQFSKSSSIYNSLAGSAFLLLCYNPFWVWDVGFQLSYGAVLSIVIFMKPIYDWFFIQNKMLDLIWKSASLTIAAQILTFPVTVYYFHQFPNYFLFTNLLAVPLSSLILLGELLICITSFIPAFASIAGVVVSWLIFILNSFIEHMQDLPFSVWNHLYINLPQLILMYVLIIFVNVWLRRKNRISQ